jgi:cytochrome P450
MSASIVFLLNFLPSAATVPVRVLTKDEVLGDYLVPKGSRVGVSIYAIHHNPNEWGADVEVFRPERFSESESKGRHASAWMPFAEGPRKCVGNR